MMEKRHQVAGGGMMKDQALDIPARLEIERERDRSSQGSAGAKRKQQSACSSLITTQSSLTTDRHSIRVTREGWAWLAFAGILWVSGLYKGINLLSFLGLLMMTAWAIQWWG